MGGAVHHDLFRRVAGDEPGTVTTVSGSESAQTGTTASER